MKFDISDKVAIITGASGALARSIANSLSSSGVKLALLTRNTDSIESMITEMRVAEVDVRSYSADILSEASLREVRKRIVQDFGRIDILLNSAGGNLPGATIEPEETVFDMSMEYFKKVTDLNLNGTVLPSLVFGKIMAQQKEGAIINYSSMAVDRAITRVAGYSASKAAMENFTRWLAVEMASKFGDGIRVNAISPGFFIGNQNRALLTHPDGSYTDRGHAIIRNTPMGRFGEAEELNGAIHFLCSDAARFITGAVLPIDGGFSAFSGV
ncbi:MAG: SDR family oxidoreductase [Bacteroidota bacterium]